MATAQSRPRLRPVEVIAVPDARFGLALLLRDTQGIAPSDVKFAPAARAILARFDGRATCADVAARASEATGETIPVDVVVRLATDLEERLFVEGPLYDAARARIERDFANADTRAASHAGGAYHGDDASLATYIDIDCFEPARAAHALADAEPSATGKLVGLVAPHIDPWRGARCYGEAYGVLARELPETATTFVVFGTSHAPMRQPFSLCRKDFDTPFGRVSADRGAIDAIADASPFDPYADQFNHKREHSIEFQVVFLRHLLGDRPIRIVPILAGLGESQETGRSPRESRDVERFLEAVRHVVQRENAVVVAGADLAHVGPRFGDPKAYDEKQRRKLASVDRESLDHAATLDAERFFDHVAGDLDTRRVCGLAPIYSLLRTIDPKALGRLGHYEQTVDREEGSIVSHAALGFFR